MALNVKKCAARCMLARMDAKVEIREVPTNGPDEQMIYSLLVDGGLSLPRALRATVDFQTGVTYEVLLTLDTATRGYAVTELTLKSPGGITAASVRDTALPRILHVIASGDPFASLTETLSYKQKELRDLTTAEGLARWRERARSESSAAGPTAEVLRWVARVYVWFAAIGGRPAKGVEQVLGIPPRTASRWISVARERGLIRSEGNPDGAPTDPA